MAIRPTKETEGIHIVNKDIKLYLSVRNIISHIENSKEYMNIISQLINIFSYYKPKTDVQNVIFLHIITFQKRDLENNLKCHQKAYGIIS